MDYTHFVEDNSLSTANFYNIVAITFIRRKEANFHDICYTGSKIYLQKIKEMCYLPFCLGQYCDSQHSQLSLLPMTTQWNRWKHRLGKNTEPDKNIQTKIKVYMGKYVLWHKQYLQFNTKVVWYCIWIVDYVMNGTIHETKGFYDLVKENSCQQILVMSFCKRTT